MRRVVSVLCSFHTLQCTQCQQLIVQIESFSLSLPPSLTTACTDCSSLSLTSCYVPTDAVVQLWSGGHCLCLSCTPATNQKRNKWRHYCFIQNLCRRLAIFWSNYQHPRLGHCMVTSRSVEGHSCIWRPPQCQTTSPRFEPRKPSHSLPGGHERNLQKQHQEPKLHLIQIKSEEK